MQRSPPASPESSASRPSPSPKEGLRPGQRTRWAIEKAGLTAAAESDELPHPAPVLRLLASRQISGVEALRRFFEPTVGDLHDPSQLAGMQAAVQRIQQAVQAGERILIYGDYDVDGTTATVLLKTAIERIAPHGVPARVTYHVPHRLREGYGMQTSRLASAAEDGISLVISVDTGIRAFAAATEAKALGLDLIVTDHHLPDGTTGVPEAVAVINPAQSGCGYANKNLCGAGVVFKLAHALLAAHATTSSQQQHLERRLLPSLLKLVAIATIADSVELTGENRTLVAIGLDGLRNPVQPGLRALMQVAKLPLDKSPTATDIAFRLAPRINAAGRMDVASDVVELFLTRDAAEAQRLAEKLDHLNSERRAAEAEALAAIELDLALQRTASGEHPPVCIVLEDPRWHRGVLGILAARVVERTGRPALVLCSDEDGQAHGSGRSIAGYHLLDALTAAHAGEMFSRFGGHAHAVGFSLAARHVGELRLRMERHSEIHLQPESLAPTTHIDAELSASEVTLDLVRGVARCAPFGQGNLEPVFLIRGLQLTAAPRIIKQRHVALSLAGETGTPALGALGWSRTGQPEWAARLGEIGLNAGDRLDVVARLRENLHPEFGGIELELLDLALVHESGLSEAVLPSFAKGKADIAAGPGLINPLRFEALRVL